MGFANQLALWASPLLATPRVEDDLVRASKPPGDDHGLHLSHYAFREVGLKSTVRVCHVCSSLLLLVYGTASVRDGRIELVTQSRRERPLRRRTPG